MVNIDTTSPLGIEMISHLVVWNTFGFSCHLPLCIIRGEFGRKRLASNHFCNDTQIICPSIRISTCPNFLFPQKSGFAHVRGQKVTYIQRGMIRGRRRCLSETIPAFISSYPLLELEAIFRQPGTYLVPLWRERHGLN